MEDRKTSLNKNLIIHLIFAILILGFTGQCLNRQKTDLYERLNSIPNAEIKEIKPDSIFSEAYEIKLQQSLDHNNPEGEKFKQRLFLSHIGYDRPVVFITEGYSLRRNYLLELSSIMRANQIRVEHRYFGESRPDSIKWEYLNIKQAAADHHRIVEIFKKIYKGKWISTGWSKGGQTAIFHRRFYPDDVEVTLPYDAPLNFSQEDARIDQFFDKVRTENCREKLIAFQRMILEHKKEILPLFRWYAKGKEYTYSIGEEKAFEYIVLEYPFSFWQYHKIDCDLIPEDGATVDEILEHLNKVVSFSSYSDHALNSASMYQFSTELGYYGYVQKNVKDLLSSDNYSNTIFAPQDVDLTFKPERMQDINKWLQENGNNFIYIYGELDPWSASQVEVSEKTNALKMILKGGNHYTFINSFPDGEKEIVLSTLEKWLGVKIER